MTEITIDNFAEEVFQNKQPVVLKFWAPWCGPCKPVAKHLEELDEKWGNSVAFASVNIDDQPSIAQQFQVRGVPTVFFINNGRAMDAIVGGQPKAAYDQKIARMTAIT